MRRLITSALLLLCLATTVPVFAGNASAVDLFKHTCDSGASASDASVCEDVQNQQDSSENPINKIIKAAIEVLSFIIGVAAIIVLVASGLRMILSNGDSNAVASARNGIIYAVAGIAVVAIAQGIVVFVLNRVH
jgi:hypothetical protein